MSCFNQLRRFAPVWILLAGLILPILACAQEQKADLIVVRKSDHILELWSNGAVIAKYPIALGFNPKGHKEREGDGKTPEGIYTIIDRNENSHYYKSLKIDYPNSADAAAALARHVRPGGDIMIHGLPSGRSAEQMDHPRHDWTNGCIALTNDQMENVWEHVDKGTSILVMP